MGDDRLEDHKFFYDEESFRQDLEHLARYAVGDRISLGQVESLLKGRGFATLCMILCVPFLQPIPVPGLSLVFGITIMILGAKLAFGHASSLPGFVARREMDTALLQKLVGGVRKIFSYFERLFKPRLTVLGKYPFLNLIGLCLLSSGLALSLPLPPIILFSNALPAWSIFFICLGYLERDGIVMIIGCLLGVLTWIYFAFWWEVVKYTINSIVVFFY